MKPVPTPARRPVNLHLTHSRGGGTARFIEDFARADQRSQNLTLQSFGTSNCFGLGLRLSRAGSDKTLGSWVLNDPVTEVRDRHPEGRRLLASICEKYRVEHIYLSSLIGHSLEVFRLGVPITRIYHDYFPECPAVHLYRGKVCTSCTPAELELCTSGNELIRPMAPTAYYLALRTAVGEAMAAADVRHVSPSHNLIENLRRIVPGYDRLRFSVIEHGIAYRKRDCFGGAEEGRRLRVGLLGHLGSHKGLGLVESRFDRLRAIADLHFLGAGEPARHYAERWGCRFVATYRPEALPEVLDISRLDLMLFPSIVPESYSYTLSEARCFCLPPAAFELGAIGDRIEHGVDGFLLAPGADAIIDFLLEADRQRSRLREVAARLRARPVRSVDEMVQAYYSLRGAAAVPVR